MHTSSLILVEFICMLIDGVGFELELCHMKFTTFLNFLNQSHSGSFVFVVYRLLKYLAWIVLALMRAINSYHRVYKYTIAYVFLF